MGIFYKTMGLAVKGGSEYLEMTAMVDTGSVYTFVPAPLLENLGVVPEWSSEFELADGRRVEYSMGEVRVRLDGQERTTVCIFGPPGCEPLLGVVALESFGLAADPVNQRLVPARLFLASLVGSLRYNTP